MLLLSLMDLASQWNPSDSAGEKGAWGAQNLLLCRIAGILGVLAAKAGIKNRQGLAPVDGPHHS